MRERALQKNFDFNFATSNISYDFRRHNNISVFI